MINLSEAWKEAYETFLDEEDAKFDENFTELSKGLFEAQKSVQEGFDVIREYFEIYEMTETLTKEPVEMELEFSEEFGEME